jgi:hypothetical protein
MIIVTTEAREKAVIDPQITQISQILKPEARLFSKT